MPVTFTDSPWAVLPVQDLQAGLAILEIQAHSSILTVYHEGVLAHRASLPWGDAAITADIQMGLHLTPLDAARLKDHYGCAWAALAPEGLSVALPGVSAGQPDRHVSLRTLAAIIEARLKEILEWAGLQLNASGLTRERLMAGIVLAGPGAGLPYLTSLAAFSLCLPARLWTPQDPRQAAVSRRAYSLHAAIGAQCPRPAATRESLLPMQKPSITNTHTRKIKGFALGSAAARAARHMQEAGSTGLEWVVCEEGMVRSEASAEHVSVAASIAAFDRWLDEGPSLVLILVCLGGEEGTAAAIRLAARCYEKNIPSFGIFTMPFASEPPDRQERALAGIAQLKYYVGTLQVFHYEALRCQLGTMPFEAAFRHSYGQMGALVRCLTGMVFSPPPFRQDISAITADIRRGGMAYSGTALAGGADRAGEAFRQSVEDGLPRLAELSDAQWVFVTIRTADGGFAALVDEVDLIRQFILRLAGHGIRLHLAWQSDASLGAQMSLSWVAAGFRGLSRRLLEALLAPISFATDGRAPQLRISLGQGARQRSCFPPGFHLPPSLVPLHAERCEEVLPRPWSPRTGTPSQGFLTDKQPDSPAPCPSPLDRLQLHQEGRKGFDPNSDRPMVIRENAAADEGITISARPGTDSIEAPALQDEVEERKRSEATTDDKLRSLSLRLDNAFDPTPKPERISPFIRRGSPECRDAHDDEQGSYSPVSIRIDAYSPKAFLSTLNTFLYGWKPD